MKTFSISYNGEALEEISAKSKNRVREYIRDFYKDETYTTNCGGFYKLERYILKNFEIREVQEDENKYTGDITLNDNGTLRWSYEFNKNK